MFGLYQSTIGKKVIVAFTGLVLFGFVIVHLLGNLQIFLGPDAFNDYSYRIKETGWLLWTMRALLLGAVIFHIQCTVQLARRNRASRPEPYALKKNIESSLASRTMLFGGIFLLFYIVYHLLHFTFGSVHPDFDPSNIYANVVKGFSLWPVSVFYLAGMVALGFHLYHGVWSVFQTLGLNHPKYNAWRRTFATFSAVGIAFGYSVIPLAVLFGFLR